MNIMEMRLTIANKLSVTYSIKECSSRLKDILWPFFSHKYESPLQEKLEISLTKVFG